MLNLASLNQRVNYLTGKINSLPNPPVADTLSAVLTAGNSAGSNNINMNSNNITNVSLINGSVYPPAPPATPALSAVLTAGNNANGLNIINLNDLGVTTINGSAYPPVVPADTLQQVLTAGNSATGTMAEITLINTDVGNIANPILNLQNSNATGSVALEIYKNKPTPAVNGDVLFTQSVFGKDSGNAKQEFTRINHSVRDVTAGVEDGSIEFGCFVNGAVNTFLQINGNENEVNILRTLDMTGNNIRTSTGDLTITAVGSSGTGNVALSAKGSCGVGGNSVLITTQGSSGGTGDISLTPRTLSYINADAPVLTDSIIATKTGYPATPASTINFSGSSTQKFSIQSTSIGLNSSVIGLQTDIVMLNDATGADNLIQQSSTDTTGSITMQSFCEQATQKVYLNDTRTGYNQSIDINNGYTNSENRISMFKNSGGGIYNEAVISNQVNTQGVYLTSTNNAVGKQVALTNGSGSAGSLVYSNTEDTNGFSVASSNTNLTLQTTGTISGQGDIVLAPSQNGSANGQIVFTGASLQSNSSGGNSGEHLVIVLNGNTYKIKLENP
jgi:hypothetical protein